jgi:hypothetical protein
MPVTSANAYGVPLTGNWLRARRLGPAVTANQALRAACGLQFVLDTL